MSVSEKWRSSKYNIGYVYNCNGIAYTRISNVKKTTKLTFDIKNKKECLRILDYRISIYLNPELEKELIQSAIQTKKTIFEAIKLFKDEQFQNFTESVKTKMSSTFATYFSENIPLDDDLIFNHLVSMFNQSKLQLSTRIKHLQNLRRFFDYLISRDLLSKNPITILGIPKNRVLDNNIIYTKDELSKIFNYFFRTDPKNQYGLFYKFLLITGMRFQEALNLKWSNITNEGIEVHGKGDRIRYFPIVSTETNSPLFPELTELISILREQNKVKPFTWRNQDKPRKHLNRALEVLNIPKIINGKRRSVHTFRATAEYIWENEYMLPFDVICDLAGHSLAVREKSYRVKRKFKELSALIENNKKS